MSVTAKPRVVVVGAINVDFVVNAPRLPGPGETVVGARVRRFGGGKGANAAAAAAAAGALVSLIGAIGTDDTATFAEAGLRDLGVDLGGLLKVEDEPTGVALIVVDARGENQIAVASGANSRLTGMAVERLLSGLIETTDCVLVSTEIGAEAVNAAVRMACDAGVRCVLNPAPPQPGILESISRGAILTPNRSELASLVKMLDLEATFPSKAADGVDQLHDLASRLSHVSGAPVVVTLGAEGALLMRPDASHVTFAAIQTVVRDTTGAGDTFNGALAAALAGGASMSSAIKAATAAASRSVSDSGARTRQDHPTS